MLWISSGCQQHARRCTGAGIHRVLALVRVMVNHRSVISDLVVKWPGSTQNSFVWANSAMGEQAERDKFGQSLILWDNGYLLRACSQTLTERAYKCCAHSHLSMSMQLASGSCTFGACTIRQEECTFVAQLRWQQPCWLIWLCMDWCLFQRGRKKEMLRSSTTLHASRVEERQQLISGRFWIADSCSALICLMIAHWLFIFIENKFKFTSTHPFNVLWVNLMLFSLCTLHNCAIHQ